MLVEAAEESSEQEGANEDVEKENPEVVYSRCIAVQDTIQQATLRLAISTMIHLQSCPWQ